MALAGVSAVCGGCLSGGLFSPERRKPATPTGPALVVATYNVNFGVAAPARGIRAIRECGADIVCLQETNELWQQHLEGALAKQYPYRAFLPSGGGAGGMAVLSRVRFDPPRVLCPPEGGWFPAWRVLAHTPLGPVQLLNLHLRPPLGAGPSVSIGAYFATQGVRKREVQQYMPELDPDVPAIVLGDLNEGDSGSAVAWLKSRGFADALAPFDPTSPTWVWQTSLLKLQERYDHLLHSPHLRCLSARVVPLGRSDHYPVVATFAAAPHIPAIPSDEQASR